MEIDRAAEGALQDRGPTFVLAAAFTPEGDGLFGGLLEADRDPADARRRADDQAVAVHPRFGAGVGTSSRWGPRLKNPIGCLAFFPAGSMADTCSRQPSVPWALMKAVREAGITSVDCFCVPGPCAPAAGAPTSAAREASVAIDAGPGRIKRRVYGLAARRRASFLADELASLVSRGGYPSRKERSLKLAIHNPSFTYPGGPENIAPVLAATARAAEEGGADQFTLMDHWFQIAPIGPPNEPMLEGYTALGFVAAQTERMRLGLLVTGVTYRHPGLLAKIVTTLDVLSGGRAELGIGAAWFEEEHDALGVPYPPIGERFERLEEAIQICFQMWSDDDGPYEGKHYKLAETMCCRRRCRSRARR